MLDNDYENKKAKEASSKSSPYIHAYSGANLSTVLRNINKRPVQFAKDIAHKTWHTMLRLGLNPKVTRDLTQAVEGDKIPGSDSFEMNSFRDWCDTLDKEDADSLEQLIVIDATARTKVLNAE